MFLRVAQTLDLLRNDDLPGEFIANKVLGRSFNRTSVAIIEIEAQLFIKIIKPVSGVLISYKR